MIEQERKYSVRVDGFELTKITLSYDEYKTQSARDEIRRKIAATYKVPVHYIKLCQVAWTVYAWDTSKQKNIPKGCGNENI